MSYHGTHVVVIEIPEGSWRAGGQTIDTEKISKLIGHPGPKTLGRSTGERSQAKGYKGLVIGDTSRNGKLCTLRRAEAVSRYSDGSEASSTSLA
jgi:hypothetical protein